MQSLSGRERVLRALRGEPVDTVPIVEWAVHPVVAEALEPGCADVPEAMARLGLDAVCAHVDFARVWQSGRRYGDEWGVTYVANAEMTAHPVDGPVKSRADLAAWQPPDPAAPQRLAELRRVVERYRGGRAIVVLYRAAFMHSCYVAGMERLLEWFAADADLAMDLLAKVAETNEQVIRHAIRAGAEVVVLADDYAGTEAPLFSPTMFRRFVLPHLQRMVKVVHEEGALAVKHTDGNIWPLIEDIVGTGIDGLNPLEPVAGMDLGEVKARYGQRVCLIGNIDCGELLSRGTPEQVEAAVREAIRVGAPGGRFMLASSNAIHSSVRPENYRAMIDAARRWGRQ